MQTNNTKAIPITYPNIFSTLQEGDVIIPLFGNKHSFVRYEVDAYGIRAILLEEGRSIAESWTKNEFYGYFIYIQRSKKESIYAD